MYARHLSVLGIAGILCSAFISGCWQSEHLVLELTSDADADSDTDTGSETDVDGCYEGDFLIEDAQDVDVLASYPCVTGDLFMDHSVLESVMLPSLMWVGGSVIFRFNDNLTTLTLGSLSEVGGTTLAQDLPLCGAVQIRENGLLADLNLGALTTVAGDVTVDENAALASLEMNALASVGGRLWVTHNAALANLRLDALEDVDGVLRISYDDVLESLDGLGALVSTGDLWIYGNNSLGNLDGLTALMSVNGDLIIGGNGSLPQCEACDLEDQLSSLTGTATFDNNQPDECSDLCE